MSNPIIFTSALPAEDLRFESMTASAGLSMLGEIQLNLISQKPDLMPEDLLGKTATVTMTMGDDAKRYFHGYVTRFGIAPPRGHHYGYQATVRPWLWFLTRTADCRIFQEETVPDIVKKVFSDHGIADFEFKTFRTYRKWTYCVQYRESDYNFIARLLEHEGIYWYFEHTDSSHKLVLVDSHSAHDAAPGCASLPYLRTGATAAPELEYIANWSFARQVKTGAMATTSYDFERPSTSLKVQTVDPFTHELADYEVFDYQGDFIQAADGTQLTENRVDELHAQYELLRGSSNAYGLCCGHLLKMTRHPREDQNAEYLVTSQTIHAQLSTGQGDGSGQGYHCNFSAIPSSQQFRPPRRTPKPFVQGPQTAVVVGPSGEEIFTDKFGRVKVQFHWDRYGLKNEKSSCWIRVSQPWAGKGWGAVSIPRIGQEVVVDFLEGDPDQPIVTGRVYNADQSVPFELPAGAVVSGIKSKSHKAGGFNELSMDDTAGKEKFTIHGQYDMGTTVLHDQTSTVKNNRTDKVDVDDAETVGNNQTQTVGANQTIKVGADRKKTIGGSETVNITGHRSETVNAGEDVTINGARSHSVNGVQTTTISIAEAHTVGAGRAHSVGGGEAITVGAAQMVSIGGAQMVSVGAVQKVNVGGIQSFSIGGAQSFSVAGPHKLSAAVISVTSKGIYKLKAAGTALFEAPTIILKAGGSKIIMNSSGITIKGAKVTVKADGNVTINGGSGIKLKGPSIGEN
jgi:type VI secretion system secreted protein VgrG